MSSMDLTREWLHTVTRPYASRERLVPEVIGLLTARRTLAVKTDAFTFDSGQTSLLVLLHGTLPISFRGATYHIPINVWIPHDYPRSPPLAYVVPTRDMGVRKGKEVDPGGRVKEEVVDAWWASWPDKTIEVLLRQLVAIFSAVPPVYAKPAQAPAAPTPAAGPSQPPPPPVRPIDALPQYHASGNSGFIPGHAPQPSLPQGYASPPRSPVVDGQPPIPARPVQPPYRQGSLPPNSPVRNGTPPVPHRPHVQVPVYAQSGPTSPMSAGLAPPPRPQSVHAPPNGYQYAPQQPMNGYAASPPPIPQHPPPTGHQPQYQPVQPRPPQMAYQAGTVQTHLRVAPAPAKAAPISTRPADLMSGADDMDEVSSSQNSAGPPPPLPPSKPPPPSTLHLHSILLPHLQASLPPLLHQLQSSHAHLTERKADLESGEPAIRDEMARLQAVKKVCDSTGRKMDEVVQAGSARVADLEQRGETSVDEVVCGISIVHNQLIDLVAEDNAIEDTIYHITRALDAERIDLDRFLKTKAGRQDVHSVVVGQGWATFEAATASTSGNPIPIRFIRALAHKKDHTDAEMILKAVAAQTKKIMEQRYMFVHTLEEAEYNTVFAGRNWNHGQTIELVLRGPSGRFLPLPYIISVMCHEMAHIEQMNHGPKFQSLNKDIKADVARMQAGGNYGDGFWSDGQRLKDNVKMGAEGLKPSDFPEYVCGVTAGDAKKARPRKQRTASLVKGEASHTSGRQTDYRRKAGRRNNVDMGEAGARLDGSRQITKEDRETRKEEIDTETERLVREGYSKTGARKAATEQWDVAHPWFKGSTHGKTAKSRSAAEMRAAAIEARLSGLAPPLATQLVSIKDEPDDNASQVSSMDDDIEVPIKFEPDDIDDPHLPVETRRREIEADMDSDAKRTLRGGWEEFFETVGRKRSAEVDDEGRDKRARSGGKPSFGASALRQETLRGFGMASTTLGGSSRKLGPRQPAASTGAEGDPMFVEDKPVIGEWTCKSCTYANIADHGRCAMCGGRPDGNMPNDIY